MRDPYYYDTPTRRPWLIALPLIAVVALALAWTGLWYYAAGAADTLIADWRAREAAAGRVYDCGEQTISGYPFRFELNCSRPAADLRSIATPIAINAKNLVVAAQIYQPSLLIGEIAAPFTISQRGDVLAADWTLAQVSVRGRPPALERVSVVIDSPKLARVAGGTSEPLASAAHMEMHARQVPRPPQDDPIFDLALNVVQGIVPGTPQLAQPPLDADVSALLRGLNDLSPKPLPQLLRELQAANGRLEIKSLRLRQGDVVVVGSGKFGLTAAGRLDGEASLTVAGLEQLLVVLGVDKKVGQASQNAVERIAPGLDLNRLFGSRGNAALAVAGVSMLGKPAEIEGRQAVTLPLRVTDGVAFLGPLRVGELAPLF